MAVIEPIPAFQDNYIWLLHDAGAEDSSGASVHVVDPGDAEPVLAELQRRNLRLATIVLTHHHFDHVGGVRTLKEATGCRVIGPNNPSISDIDETLEDGDSVTVGSYHFDVLAVPGHTLDHIAYFQAASEGGNEDGAAPVLLCGDTLFAGGCGRIFEGDPPMMYSSLQRLAALPGDTRVYCAHEYTLANLAFAQAADPQNIELQQRIDAARATRERGEPTVPSTIRLELETNPFLRSAEPGPRAALEANGLSVDSGDSANASPVATFAALRAWKDSF